MTLIKNEDGTFTLERENGSVTLTANEVCLICNQFLKYSLRESIEYKLTDMDGDSIDLSKYPYSFEELVDEIFTDLEDEIDCGNPPSDDDIEEKILDIASFYEMEVQ